jgi:glycerol-3-phosphate dehydrogenase
MPTEDFDIVVVGAGIHGAGVAQAAAARGHTVLVLEQHAVGSGTSSRSSKLIHGGLRYLETAQFALVRESLAERALLLKLAPGLVRLVPFHIPIYDDTRRRPWQVRAGLALYTLLAGFGPASGFAAVPRRDWARLDGLETRGLRQVFRYHDAQTDDLALTRAVIGSALGLGARLRAPARFDGAELVDGACVVDYVDQGRERQCRARVLVNAGGPWINDILARVIPAIPLPAIELVQGSHIVIDGELSQGVYYMEAPRDRRAVFAMPWQRKTLIGTTETAFAGDPATVAPLAAERDYLLECFGRYFPGRIADAGRTVDAFAGLRVLPAGGGAAFGRPRDTRLHVDRVDHPRVLTICGGKLTTWRSTAEKVLQRLMPSLPPRRPVATTATLPLRDSGSGPGPGAAVSAAAEDDHGEP